MVDDRREVPNRRQALEIIVSELVLLLDVGIRLTVLLLFLGEISLGASRLTDRCAEWCVTVRSDVTSAANARRTAGLMKAPMVIVESVFEYVWFR